MKNSTKKFLLLLGLLGLTTFSGCGLFEQNTSTDSSEQSGSEIVDSGNSSSDAQKEMFTVTFNSNGGSAVAAQSVEEGAYATAPDTPTKESTVSTEYVFEYWYAEEGVPFDFATTAITGNLELTAKWAERTQQYKVTFANEDGTELQSGLVNYGVVPEYAGETPEKTETVGYTYVFAGWDTTIVAVTGEVTYTATYTENVKQYKVTFANEDGTELQSGLVNYGVVPEYAGETPEKAETVEHTYVFAGWNTTVVAVAGEVTYTATYTENARCYSVSVTDGTADVESAAYGSTITLSTEGKDGYVFMGWTVNGSAIEGNTFTLVNDAVVVAVYVESCEIALTADKTGKLFYSATESVENMLTLTAATKYSTEITWVSDNVAVATVENGVVTACGKGTAKITATAAATGETATYEVSVQNYYSISTVAEFWAIENEMDAYYALTQDIDFSGSEMRMGLGVSQAVMDSVNPDSCTAFTGVLDGNGYALKNVSVGGSSVQVLFGANKGTIKNLAVEANWTQGWDGVQGVGMLFANYGVVENVYFKGAFVTNTWNDLSFISMVCRNFSEIKNCVAVLDLTKVAGNNWNNAGMICWGYSGSKITNSYVYGNVTGATMTGSVRLVANAGSTDTVVTNSNVYTSEKEMMDAVKAGTELSDVWTVVETDATYTLKFGDEKVAEWNYAVALDGGNYSLKDGQDLTASGFDGTVTDIVYNGTSVVANCDVSTSGSIVVPAAVMSQLSAGEQVITVKTATTVYKVTLSVYTDIVTSVEEFWAIENDMAGKYLLGNDIDFSGATTRFGLGVTQTANDNVSAESCTAFTGVLDGNGYALKNYTVDGNTVQTVFGYNKGVIKNLAVYATWKHAWDGTQCITMMMRNDGTLENVYFSGKFLTNSWNDLNYISMVARNCGELKNCVAVLDVSDVTGNTGNPAGLITYGYPAGDTYPGSKLTNSYVCVINNGTTFTGDVRLAANAGGADYCTITNSSAYTAEAELYSAIKADATYTGVWTIKDNVLYFGEIAVYTYTA